MEKRQSIAPVMASLVFLVSLSGILVSRPPAYGGSSFEREHREQIGKLMDQIKTLKVQVDALNEKLKYVTVQGTDVIFSGCNVHVRNGSGYTRGARPEQDAVTNGLGNLIVGYNETYVFSPGDALWGVYRTGSHNLVVGPAHSYSSYGGFVAGLGNTAAHPHGSVSGGGWNSANGIGASVNGGTYNEANNTFSSVSGGAGNSSGGYCSSVAGGGNNFTVGQFSTITGGKENSTLGDSAVVGGGYRRRAPSDNSWAAGSLFESQ